MPSTFLPSYYPERNHHLLPSYARSPGSGGGRDYGSSHNDDRRGNDRAGSGSGDSGRNYTRDNNTNNSSSNRHQRQSYRDDYTSEADLRSPNPHLLDGIALSEPLVQSPHGSPRLVIGDDILDFAGPPSTDRDRSGLQRDSEGDKTKIRDKHRDREGNRGDEREGARERDKGQGGRVEQPPYKPKDWGWAEIPLYGREDPTAMADIKAAGYLGDLYASKSGPWVNGKDVSAEEYAQVSPTAPITILQIASRDQMLAHSALVTVCLDRPQRHCTADNIGTEHIRAPSLRPALHRPPLLLD